MKLQNTDKHSRTLLATGLPHNLEIQITYTGYGNCEKAIPLDSLVVPQIKRAVNSFDELLAELNSAVERAQEAQQSLHSDDLEGVQISLDYLIEEARLAIAKATEKEATL